MKAFLKNYRQSPRKVRNLTDMVKGASVPEALSMLEATPRKASEPLAKLIRSAAANALHTSNVAEADLYVQNIEVNKGIVMKRFRPRAYGRAFPIRKRTSHVQITLGTKPEGKSDEKKETKETKETKKVDKKSGK